MEPSSKKDSNEAMRHGKRYNMNGIENEFDDKIIKLQQQQNKVSFIELERYNETMALRQGRGNSSYSDMSMINDEKLRSFIVGDSPFKTKFASAHQKPRLPTIYEHSICNPPTLYGSERPLRGLRFPRTESLPQNRFIASLNNSTSSTAQTATSSATKEESITQDIDFDDMRSASSTTISSSSSYSSSSIDGSQSFLSFKVIPCLEDESMDPIVNSTVSGVVKQHEKKVELSQRHSRIIERKRPTKLEIDEKLKKLEASFPSPSHEHSAQSSSVSPANRNISPLNSFASNSSF